MKGETLRKTVLVFVYQGKARITMLLQYATATVLIQCCTRVPSYSHSHMFRPFVMLVKKGDDRDFISAL